MIGAIHVYTLSTPGGASVTPEGRVVHGDPVNVEVRGSVDQLSARDVEIAAQVGQRHDISCRCPLDVTPDPKAQVIVTEPETLAGTYEIDTIRTTRAHHRLLCSKVST